jgi:hypothetical protein
LPAASGLWATSERETNRAKERARDVISQTIPLASFSAKLMKQKNERSSPTPPFISPLHKRTRDEFLNHYVSVQYANNS